MDDDHLSIGRELDVQLNGICLLGKGKLEGGQGIFRCMSRCTAVGKDDRLSERFKKHNNTDHALRAVMRNP